MYCLLPIVARFLWRECKHRILSHRFDNITNVEYKDGGVWRLWMETAMESGS